MAESANFFNKQNGLPALDMGKKLPYLRTSLPRVDLKLFEEVDIDIDSENLDGLADGMGGLA